MDLTKYRNKLIGSEDERAVSPVIGVILMVAITVILAAVIAAFVLDIGDMDDPAPNAQFDSEQFNDTEDEVITFTHSSGDSVNTDFIEIEHNGDHIDGDDITRDESLSAGQTVSLVGEDGTTTSQTYFEEGDEISLVWDNGDTSSTLATHTVSMDLHGSN